MGVIVIRNQPCLNDRCGSSDARQIYEKGDSHCFSCGKDFPAPKKGAMADEEIGNDDDDFIPEETTVVESKEKSSGGKHKMDEIKTYPIRGFRERGIKKQICEFYDVRVAYDDAGNISHHYYPYVTEKTSGYKVRQVEGKKFTYIGDAGGLFGRHLFPAGGKRIIITEGELDAMSLAQAYWDKHERIYPVVSMPSATGTKELLANREYLRSFGEVILCFDNDEAGKESTDKAIKIIGIDKVKIANLGNRKDPNEMFLADGGQTLLTRIYDAEVYKPAGIIGKAALKEQMRATANKPFVPYPACLTGLNTKLKGMRTGDIALYISGTGSGKSTVIREVELHLLEVTSDKIGIISLEETPGETARNLSCMAIKKNRAAEEVPTEEMDKGFDMVFSGPGWEDEERVIILDHQGSIKDESIVDQLEYMALMGCKYMFIDHITILVSEGADGLTGNEAIDKIMNDLLRIAKKHDVHIGLVSHLRKAKSGDTSFEEGKLPSVDDIRGSGSIKQVSMDIIAFARNMTHDSPEVRNTIVMSVLKCRETGLTGPVPGAYYDFATGRLKGPEHVPPPPDDEDEFQKI